MTLTPFVSNYGINTSVSSINVSNFLVGATNNPTGDAESYARWQRVGTFVRVEFQIQFATVGTTGALSINLPVPLSPLYQKPQSIFHIRYVTGDKVHYGFYNRANDNTINLVAQTTFGGAANAVTSTAPDTLNVGDVLSGVILYETV